MAPGKTLELGTFTLSEGGTVTISTKCEYERELIVGIKNIVTGKTYSESVNAGINLTHQSQEKIDPPLCLVSNRFRFLVCLSSGSCFREY